MASGTIPYLSGLKTAAFQLPAAPANGTASITLTVTQNARCLVALIGRASAVIGLYAIGGAGSSGNAVGLALYAASGVSLSFSGNAVTFTNSSTGAGTILVINDIPIAS